MPTWGFVLLVALLVVLSPYVAGTLLPYKFTGKAYFKKLLWGDGVDWRSLPDGCIRDFVADALNYAKSVSSAQQAC